MKRATARPRIIAAIAALALAAAGCGDATSAPVTQPAPTVAESPPPTGSHPRRRHSRRRARTGGGTWAVLPEHVVTLALANAKQNGQAIGRVFDLQAEWAAATGSSPRIPQAEIVVRGELLERPTAVAALLDALETSISVVNAAEADTLTSLSEASGVPAPVVGQVIPRLNLEVVAAAEAREELDQFFSQLATLSPDIIGGGLPDVAFYLPDPR